MSVFDLLFLFLVLTAALTLIAAVGLALAGHRDHSLRVLKRLGFGAVFYFSVVIVVSLIAPRRTYHLGDNQCFDDWCIAATSVAPTGQNSCTIGLRISSRARRISQRERDLVLYLTDESEGRYFPRSQSSDLPLSSLLNPGESISLTRTFSVPRSAKDVNLVIAHGGFPIGWFIIGYNSWFRKAPVVLLPPMN